MENCTGAGNSRMLAMVKQILSQLAWSHNLFLTKSAMLIFKQMCRFCHRVDYLVYKFKMYVLSQIMYKYFMSFTEADFELKTSCTACTAIISSVYCGWRHGPPGQQATRMIPAAKPGGIPGSLDIMNPSVGMMVY